MTFLELEITPTRYKLVDLTHKNIVIWDGIVNFSVDR